MTFKNHLISSRKKNEKLNNFLKYLSNFAILVNHCHIILSNSILKIRQFILNWVGLKVFDLPPIFYILLYLKNGPRPICPIS